MKRKPNAEPEMVPIPLTPEAIVRLARLERCLGEPAIAIAGRLLDDVLKQDLIQSVPRNGELLN